MWFLYCWCNQSWHCLVKASIILPCSVLYMLCSFYVQIESKMDIDMCAASLSDIWVSSLLLWVLHFLCFPVRSVFLVLQSLYSLHHMAVLSDTKDGNFLQDVTFVHVVLCFLLFCSLTHLFLYKFKWKRGLKFKMFSLSVRKESC